MFIGHIRPTMAALIIAVVLSACSNKWSDVIAPEVSGSAITMGSSVVDTRSLIGSVNDIQNTAQGHLSLFGRITTGGTSTRIFNNTDLAYNTSSSTWEYSPTQYWVSGSTYDFKAFWPYKSNASNFTYTASSNELQYSGGYVSQLGTTAQTDLMVASASRNPKTEGTGRVQLPLKHALAAVRFSVKNLTNNEFYLVGQCLRGIKNSGTLMVCSADGTITWDSAYSGITSTSDQFACSSSRSSTPTGSTYAYPSNSSNDGHYYYWYRTFTGGIHTYVSATTKYQLFTAANFYNTSGYVFDSDGYLLIIPQDVTADAELRFGTCARSDVSYWVGQRYYRTQVTQENYNSAVSRVVSLDDLTSVTSWQAGKKYDYVITVSTDQILFSVTLVPWTDEIIDIK